MLEYKFETVDCAPDEVQRTLNEHACAGWQIINVERLHGKYEIIFGRVVSEESESKDDKGPPMAMKG